MPITLYDIASGPPVRCFAPNPWKTRLALNFKRAHSGLQYETSWVALPQVATVRKTLGAAPNRKHAVDGSDFHTLPVIVDHDAATTTTIGDSFDIAAYLDETYPTTPPLFPPSSPTTKGLHRALNAHVDALFTAHVALTLDGMPLDPATRDVSRAEFCRRAGRARWEELCVVGEARAALLRSFEAALGGLAGCFVRRDEGPFLEGAVLMYADLIVGGWLLMMKVCLPESEWEMLREWDGGLWGRLVDALGEYADCD